MPGSLSFISVLQGQELLFSHFDTDGEMWTGSGPRSISCPVLFEPAFVAPPTVHVSIGMWDIGGSTNLRAEISAERISAEGFDIVFRTWGDTRVARIRAEWLAIGGAGDPSLWNVD